jgi:protein CpxP
MRRFIKLYKASLPGNGVYMVRTHAGLTLDFNLKPIPLCFHPCQSLSGASSRKEVFMKFALKPLASLNALVLAGLLATVGASAMAQSAPTAPVAGPMAAGQHADRHGERMDRYDPAKMQAMMVKRQAQMKAKLKITPAQEGAWTAYTASMQPLAHARPTPEQRAAFDKLTTPQRIDKMKEMRTQRMADMTAAMDKRGEATKTFYAALTPDQQKVFDTQHTQHTRHGHQGGPGHHGGPGGPGPRG